MNKVNSTPLPGCVDEIRDLNKRWDQIQEQLQSRLGQAIVLCSCVGVCPCDGSLSICACVCVCVHVCDV